MSSGGSISTMITSLKNNALPKRRRIYDRMDIYTDSNPHVRKVVEPPTLEELEAWRKKKKRVTIQLNKKRMLALAISIIIMGLILFLFYYGSGIASRNAWNEYLF